MVEKAKEIQVRMLSVRTIFLGKDHLFERGNCAVKKLWKQRTFLSQKRRLSICRSYRYSFYSMVTTQCSEAESRKFQQNETTVLSTPALPTRIL